MKKRKRGAEKMRRKEGRRGGEEKGDKGAREKWIRGEEGKQRRGEEERGRRKKRGEANAQYFFSNKMALEKRPRTNSAQTPHKQVSPLTDQRPMIAKNRNQLNK